MAHINLLLAILNAVPILDNWFKQATLAYIKMKKEKNDAEFLEALSIAKRDKDVTDIAARLGSEL